MPRHRVHNSGVVYFFPDDFPERLERFKEESGLSWAEIARRVGTSNLNLRRWRNGVRPHWRHLVALLELAEDLGLAHLFTDWTLGEATRCETLDRDVPRRNVSPGRKAAGQRGGRVPNDRVGPG